MKTTAILVDGGFYRKQATYHFGKKSAHERVHELIRYCRMHLMERSQFALVDTPNGGGGGVLWKKVYSLRASCK